MPGDTFVNPKRVLYHSVWHGPADSLDVQDVKGIVLQNPTLFGMSVKSYACPRTARRKEHSTPWNGPAKRQRDASTRCHVFPPDCLASHTPGLDGECGGRRIEERPAEHEGEQMVRYYGFYNIPAPPISRASLF